MVVVSEADEKTEAELNADKPTTQQPVTGGHLGSQHSVISGILGLMAVAVSKEDEKTEAELNVDEPTSQHVDARRDPGTGSECADEELGDVEGRGEW